MHGYTKMIAKHLRVTLEVAEVVQTKIERLALIDRWGSATVREINRAARTAYELVKGETA